MVDLQTNTSHKVCTGTDTNKASDTGVLNNGGKRQGYKNQATNVLEGENQDTKQAAKVLRRRKQRREMHQAVD